MQCRVSTCRTRCAVVALLNGQMIISFGKNSLLLGAQLEFCVHRPKLMLQFWIIHKIPWILNAFPNMVANYVGYQNWAYNYPFRIDIVMTKVLNDFDILHLRFQRPIHNIVHNVKSLKAH